MTSPNKAKIEPSRTPTPASAVFAPAGHAPKAYPAPRFEKEKHPEEQSRGQ